jgi:hypothetical protein
MKIADKASISMEKLPNGICQGMLIVLLMGLMRIFVAAAIPRKLAATIEKSQIFLFVNRAVSILSEKKTKENNINIIVSPLKWIIFER